MKGLIKILSTGMYVGYVPVGSGTLASILGVLIYLLLYKNMFVSIAICACFFILGFIISGKAEKIFKEKDSSKIVIDEIASMLLVCLFAGQALVMIAWGFIFFRIFDIVKPEPARMAGRFPGSMGIMLDDIVAAGYTIIVLFVLKIFI